jgi:FKBP-type peptidyl-prolyl cis-trans isomerase
MKPTHPIIFIPLVILLLIIALIANAIVRRVMTNDSTNTGSNEETLVSEEEADVYTGQPNPLGDIGIEVLEEGTGSAQAKDGDNLSVHYTGTLEDGTKFDSSLDRGVPFTLTLGANQVIQGWELGLQNMKVGEKRKLTIPPDLAYGDRALSKIPANSTLIFEVELLSIN